ncbi:MAG: ELWxxDGT repeat protein [Acidobacteriota bacterium]
MRTIRVLLLSLALVAAAHAALTPYLVKDINPESTFASSNPQAFLTLGDLVLFWVDKFGQTEIWRSDGTASGTYRLGEAGESIGVLAVTDKLCLLRYTGLDYRRYLWITDGTLPGTFSLGETHDEYPLPGQAAWVPEQGLIYFTFDQGQGIELWRTDGTPGGAYKVADTSFPSLLTSFQGRLYFQAYDDTGHAGLWRSDGTAQGTVLIRNVWFDSLLDSLHVVGSRLVFLGYDNEHGSELWASDGTTAGTRRIADLMKGWRSPEYREFKVFRQRLYFTAGVVPRGEELYVTDGTVQGTAKVTSFANGDPYIHALQPLNGRLFFVASDLQHGWELWSTNGTPAGTRMVVDACPGECSSRPEGFVPLHGRLYYNGEDDTHGSELWSTDGTAQGTGMVKDICQGECDSYAEALGVAGDHLFFRTSDFQRDVFGIWITDGTVAGTMLLTELAGFVIPGRAVRGLLLFSGFDFDHGRELWVSDGTSRGTHLLADIADEDVGGSNPRSFMAFGGTALFLADDVDGPGLWRSDGTEEGTALVKSDVPELDSGVPGPGVWTASADRVFFQANRHQDSFELWTSDGSESGTLRLTPEGVRNVGELSAPIAKLGFRVFFSARSPDHGLEPWVTDGTEAGTRLLADLKPGPSSSSPDDFTVFRGRAWFAARSRLWTSDGTPKGTFAVGPRLDDIDIRSSFGDRLWFTGFNSALQAELWSTDGSTPARTQRIAQVDLASDPVVHRDRLWFADRAGEIWSTDGTAAGLRNLILPDLDCDAFEMISDGAHLYVVVRRRYGIDNYRQELWITDGTPAGSRKISDPVPWSVRAVFEGRLYFVNSGQLYRSDGTEVGTQPVSPDGEPYGVQRLFRFGNRLIAFTLDGEVWETDGTANGTKLIRDLAPGLFDSSRIVKAGSHLFFPAFDPEAGWELWAITE